MKGVFDIEFILALVVFLSIISFVTYSIIANIPTFRTEAANEDLRSKAYEISNILLLNNGTDWVNEMSNGVPLADVRLGLSSPQKYLLDMTRVNAFNQLCVNNYRGVRDWFFGDTTYSDFRINLTDGNTQYISCGSVRKTSSSEFQIVRFATLDDKVVKLVVSVT